MMTRNVDWKCRQELDKQKCGKCSERLENGVDWKMKRWEPDRLENKKTWKKWGRLWTGLDGAHWQYTDGK